MSEIEITQNKLLGLLKGKYSSLQISFNDFACNYETLGKYLEHGGGGAEYFEDAFISPEERQKCIETNSVWVIHWYPDTPVGFAHVAAATLEAALDAAIG